MDNKLMVASFPRPFPSPGFDHLQYAKTGTGGRIWDKLAHE